MIGNYKIVTLCGSTKFKKEFLEVQKKLTLLGYIVISVGLFGHSGIVKFGKIWMKALLQKQKVC